MGRYWIRNRGRVQGPFNEERIQGLLRRGRFNRHYHVSEDGKNWYPAGDFPELFEGAGGPIPADNDDTPFRGGGSPFDDDDEPPRPRSRKSEPARSGRRRPQDEDPDDDFNDDEDDDADDDDDGWDEDDDWGDSDSGAVGRLLSWVEANVKPLAAVLLVVLAVLGWLTFFRESFAQDLADLNVLIEVKGRISKAHSIGMNVDDWMKMSDSTLAELEPMVTRLNKTASVRDHIKQELLWSARDEIPKMLDQLPKGNTDAEERIGLRFNRINDMITQKIRQHDGSILTLPPRAATSAESPESQPAATEAIPGAAPPVQTEASPNPGTPGQTPPQPQTSVPGQPPTTNPTPPPVNPGTPPAQNLDGVPGRPAPAKF
ncbi:MAG: DUF4339 domain-containing protein [Planctomycetaceae bacterium]